jgi:hypothetical protein
MQLFSRLPYMSRHAVNIWFACWSRYEVDSYYPDDATNFLELLYSYSLGTSPINRLAVGCCTEMRITNQKREGNSCFCLKDLFAAEVKG